MEQRIQSIIASLPAPRETPVLIAIDGRCAAGKSTLATQLAQRISGNVIAMDHFFPQPHQRTQARLDEPGGNIDYERFHAEILLPLRRAQTPVYIPFDCQTMQFSAPIPLQNRPYYILEGSYSCHPRLFPYYDLTVFLTIDPQTQLHRIRQRNGEDAAKMFAQKWIPLEEKYFEAFKIQERCAIRL